MDQDLKAKSRTSQKERRREQRLDAEAPLSLGLPGEAQEAILKNISKNGLCCHSHMLIPEMTQVRMAVRLPALPEEEQDHYMLRVQGVVVRCDPVVRTNSRRKWEIGIYFTELDDEARRLLHTYIEGRL